MLIRIAWDYLKGVAVLRVHGPCVTVFGSARLVPGTEQYEVARLLGLALGRAEFTVMTGGGPGLMEAVNRGAREAGARSIGCHLQFTFDESPNPYLDRCVTFRYFLIRKLWLFRHSCAFIVLPGGIGTMDELFELLTLIKTKKVTPVPVVMIGREFWKPLLAFFETMASARTIDAADVDALLITDDLDEATVYLRAFVVGARGRQDRMPVSDERVADVGERSLPARVTSSQARADAS